MPKHHENAPIYLTVLDVARELDVHPNTVRAWVRLRYIAAVTLPGGSMRISREELDRFVAVRLSEVTR